ncbi:uncharacterized protein LOC8264949 isoform X2 [Ricinus communis]|uniref:uncharacterized protein LOC8264949 isoform X2 n=1 Tax=Ricinus communis TaxID=3988 RepID=UPI00201AE89A|nr:uncharacterized protein LOC8264949 isoform X2 [Ricinus communis]
MASILTHARLPPPKSFNTRPLTRITSLNLLHRRISLPLPLCKEIFLLHLCFAPSLRRFRTFAREDTGNYEPDSLNEIFRNEKDNNTNPASSGNSFLILLGIGVCIAVIITITSIGLKKPSALGLQFVAEGSSSSSSSVMASAPVGFSFKAFGYRIILPEYAPGWIYFWLLMAAGCGLFISEEALNVWVGISLSRMLTVDGTWQSFVESFYRSAPYIMSTVLWVYWGVCISDMIPFYLGKLFRESGATDDIRSKLGIGEEKVLSITRVVQKYGNLAGLVERFSLGVRNPTGFLAGTLGVSPEFFFAGVCCGGLITLPLQLGIGFLLRERPMVALATVATVVLHSVR